MPGGWNSSPTFSGRKSSVYFPARQKRRPGPYATRRRGCGRSPSLKSPGSAGACHIWLQTYSSYCSPGVCSLPSCWNGRKIHLSAFLSPAVDVDKDSPAILIPFAVFLVERVNPGTALLEPLDLVQRNRVAMQVSRLLLERYAPSRMPSFASWIMIRTSAPSCIRLRASRKAMSYAYSSS